MSTMGACDIDPEMLRLCGYQEISVMMVGDGQGVSVNLINNWDKIAVTSEDLGGPGSALGRSKQVTVWGVPGETGDIQWRYDLNVNFYDDEVVVLAIRTNFDKATQTLRYQAQQGEVVVMEPPNEMEMLAAMGKALELEEAEDGRVQEEDQGVSWTPGEPYRVGTGPDLPLLS